MKNWSAIHAENNRKVLSYQEKLNSQFQEGVIDKNYLLRLSSAHSIKLDYKQLGFSSGEIRKKLKDMGKLEKNEGFLLAEGAYNCVLSYRQLDQTASEENSQQIQMDAKKSLDLMVAKEELEEQLRKSGLEDVSEQIRVLRGTLPYRCH